MAKLSLYLLGPARVTLDEEDIEVKPRKALALLIYLAVTAEPQARDFLATLLWPDSDQSNARRALRNRLSELNQALDGEWLEAGRESIGLRTGYWLDVTEFQAHLADGAGDRHSLMAAAELYRDDFLAGFTLPDCPEYDEWQFFQSESYRQALATALERLVNLLSGQGDYQEAIPYARRWLALDPLHEPAQRALIQLYAQSGQRAAALRQYEQARETLIEELGIAPSRETETLYNDIQAGRVADQPEKTRPRHNLPAETTAFVGRKRELAQIARLLKAHRLVTLSGPGGVGKTRLALAAAEAHQGDFRDGVFFVPLLSLGSAMAIEPAIATALGMAFEGGSSPRDQLLAYLKSRETLLVLDNMEHLLSGDEAERNGRGAVSLVEAMQATAPDLKILATSREVLRLASEQIYPVPGLAVKNGDQDNRGAGGEVEAEESAVELFRRRAQRVRPDFGQAADEDLEHIRQLCRLVEGMPLAIELAAARLRLLSLAEITAELQDDLAVLDMELRGSGARHGSIRLVFEASWRSLDLKQQRIFARLSVFRGGFTRQTARQVAGAKIPDLAILLDKSLIRRDVNGRFEFHALICMYATEKLAEDPAQATQARDRHRAYFARMLREAISQWRVTNSAASLATIRSEADNLLAGWRWELEKADWDEAATYLDDLWQFLKLQRRLPEAIELLEQALQTGKATEPEARLIYQARWERLLGEAYLWLSQIEEGDAHFEQVVCLLGRPLPASRAGLWLGLLKQLAIQGLHRLIPGAFVGRQAGKQTAINEAFIAFERLGSRAAIENDALLAVFCFFQALNLAEASGLPRLMARAYAFVGHSFGLISLRRIANAYLAWAQALALEETSLSLQERVFGLIGIYRAGMGRWQEAVESCQVAADAARELGQHWDEVIYLVTLLFTAHQQGQYELALDYARQVGDTARRSGDKGSEVTALYWEALTRLRQDDTDQAVRLLKQSAAAPAEVMNLFDWIILRATLAQAYLRQGAPDLALEEADKVADLITQFAVPTHPFFLDGYAGVAAIYLALWEDKREGENGRAHQSRARRSVRDLRAFARVFPVAAPQAWLQQGRYHWLEGKVRKAYEAFQKSLACAQELGMPLEQGLAHYEIGRRLPDGEQTEEGWGAREHMQRAHEIFDELGAAYDLGRATAELESRDSLTA